MKPWPPITHSNHLITSSIAFLNLTELSKTGNFGAQIRLKHHFWALEAMEALAAVLDRYMKERAK